MHKIKLTTSFASIIFALASAAVQAQNSTNIVFTELSSTELTATLNGSSIGTMLNIGPDHWEWRSGQFASFAFASSPYSAAHVYWAEPENPALVNRVVLTQFDPDPSTGVFNLGFDITSDLAGFGQEFINPNGGYGFSVYAQGPNMQWWPSVYFEDLNDATDPVPEAFPTAVMLLGATGGLMGLRFARSSRSE